MNWPLSTLRQGADVVGLIDVVLAGALGAALLAVALLYTGYRRNRALIQELRTELHSITRGSHRDDTSTATDEAPDASTRPARRDPSRLRHAARRLLPWRGSRQSATPPAPAPAPAGPDSASTGSVGVHTKEGLAKEPYGARPIPTAPTPADSGEPVGDSAKARPLHTGGGGRRRHHLRPSDAPEVTHTRRARSQAATP